jgi:hypothetical protein
MTEKVETLEGVWNKVKNGWKLPILLNFFLFFKSTWRKQAIALVLGFHVCKLSPSKQGS